MLEYAFVYGKPQKSRVVDFLEDVFYLHVGGVYLSYLEVEEVVGDLFLLSSSLPLQSLLSFHLELLPLELILGSRIVGLLSFHLPCLCQFF